MFLMIPSKSMEAATFVKLLLSLANSFNDIRPCIHSGMLALSALIVTGLSGGTE